MFIIACYTYLWRRRWHPLQCSCLENPMDGGAWWAAVHGVAKSRTQLSDFTFSFHFPALEKEMATHSSVLAWRIPGMGGARWAAVCGVAQSRTGLKRLSSSSRGSWHLSSRSETHFCLCALSKSSQFHLIVSGSQFPLLCRGDSNLHLLRSVTRIEMDYTDLSRVLVQLLRQG